jgi:hypothetical protein
MKPELELQITKDDLLNLGHIPLTKEALVTRIANTTVIGDYEYNGHRIYKSFIDANGDIESKNDWGSHIFGHYTIKDNGHFSVEWDGYWDEWTGIAFEIAEEIKFYDIHTGKWRTTFHNILEGKHPLEVQNI